MDAVQEAIAAGTLDQLRRRVAEAWTRPAESSPRLGLPVEFTALEILPLLLLMFVAMYFFMVRPQQKKAREHRALIDSLDVGDEVITASGLYGMITDFDGGTVFIEISDGVEIKISRDTIANKVVYSSDVDGDDGQGPLLSGDDADG